jgi:hypothetical protein
MQKKKKNSSRGPISVNSWAQWYVPAIPHYMEAKIWRIKNPGQLGKKLRKTSFSMEKSWAW